MIYTSYTEEQYEELPKKYRSKVVGISFLGDILQLPLCPECGNEMMEDSGYLSCTVCGYISRKRELEHERARYV